MDTFLYSTIGTDWGLEIIPHWISHHTKIGIPIEHFRLVLHSRDDRSCLRRAGTLLSKFGITPVSEWMGDFSSDENFNVRRRVFDDCSLGPDDWFLIADSDEFLDFPCPMTQMLASCNRSGHNAIEARMIDRITADGSLAEISPWPALAEQFPYESDITESLLMMNVYKVVAHKRDTFSGRLHRANHGIAPEFQSTTNLYRGNCSIAHYKWTAGLVERLEGRVQYYYQIGRTTDARKGEEFLATVRKQGKLPVEPPTLATSMTSR